MTETRENLGPFEPDLVRTSGGSGAGPCLIHD